MSYKTLMVYADEGADSDMRIALACDLARAFDAHLIGMSGSAPVPPPMGDPYLGGAMMGEALTLYRDLAERNVTRAEARFREISDAQIRGAEWRGRIGFPGGTGDRGIAGVRYGDPRSTRRPCPVLWPRPG